MLQLTLFSLNKLCAEKYKIENITYMGLAFVLSCIMHDSTKNLINKRLRVL